MAPYKRRQTDDAPEMAAEPNSENQVRTEDADATQETASVQEAEVVKPVRRRRRTVKSAEEEQPVAAVVNAIRDKRRVRGKHF